MADPNKVKLIAKNRVYDGFFKLDEITFSNEAYHGDLNDPQTHLVLERGDAVAALLYDPIERKVILVEQFRLPTHVIDRDVDKEIGQEVETGEFGWLQETVAGMPQITEHSDGTKLSEAPEACIKREIMEEVGYQVSDLTLISSFFSSPGGTSERIFLYFAEVRNVDHIATGGGDAKEGEDIITVTYDIQEFFDLLNTQRFHDPKLIIAGYWLQRNIGKHLRAEEKDEESHTVKFPISHEKDKSSQNSNTNSKQYIGFKTGNIKAMKDIDVWINSEDTDMMMDKFFGRSISSTIRYLGAKKYVKDPSKVAQDVIYEELRSKLNGRNFVKVGTVINTDPGELKATHGVKQIFHVATMEGVFGEGLQPSLGQLNFCIEKVLENIETASGITKKYKTVLIPIFGAGKGKFEVNEVVPHFVDRAIKFLKNNKKSKIKEIYFVAYTETERSILNETLMRHTNTGDPVWL